MEKEKVLLFWCGKKRKTMDIEVKFIFGVRKMKSFKKIIILENIAKIYEN